MERIGLNKLLMCDKRTVFDMQSIVLLSGVSDNLRLRQMMNYYVKQGYMLNPRRGVYAKPGYDPREMACTIFQPAYISLEYVLQRAGVTFQYDDTITCVSYQNRTIEIDDCIYSFRRINPMLWMNMQGLVQENGYTIAIPERAFLDMLYLSAGQCYFDNLRPLRKSIINQLLPTYQSKVLTQRVKDIFQNG
ncbi:MAG: hypothetical protein J6R26_07950 [Paludibacteraceae bacterium]|nr:hypothetical protein [Paludibacteraceae bacterium]